MRIIARNWKVAIALIAVVIMSSCQKEVDFDPDWLPDNPSNPGAGSGSGRSIVGDWKFAGVSTNVNTSTKIGPMETIMTGVYHSFNNAGSVKLTDNQFVMQDVSYSVNETLKMKSYLNGTFMDELDIPYEVEFPSTTASYEYVRNNADSLTFKNVSGLLSLPSAPGAALPPRDIGSRIAWSGDTLLVRMNAFFRDNVTQSGTTIIMESRSTATLKLVKP